MFAVYLCCQRNNTTPACVEFHAHSVPRKPSENNYLLLLAQFKNPFKRRSKRSDARGQAVLVFKHTLPQAVPAAMCIYFTVLSRAGPLADMYL